MSEDLNKFDSCLKYAKYMVTNLIYGGTITDENDQKVFKAMIDQFVQKIGFKGGKPYNLTGVRHPKDDLEKYRTPEFGSTETFI
jgi:hypothetical protein